MLCTRWRGLSDPVHLRYKLAKPGGVDDSAVSHVQFLMEIETLSQKRKFRTSRQSDAISLIHDKEWRFMQGTYSLW